MYDSTTEAQSSSAPWASCWAMPLPMPSHHMCFKTKISFSSQIDIVLEANPPKLLKLNFPLSLTSEYLSDGDKWGSLEDITTASWQLAASIRFTLQAPEDNSGTCMDPQDFQDFQTTLQRTPLPTAALNSCYFPFRSQQICQANTLFPLMALAAPVLHWPCSFYISVKKKGCLANRHHQGMLGCPSWAQRCSGGQTHTKITASKQAGICRETGSQSRGWGCPCYFFLQLTLSSKIWAC